MAIARAPSVCRRLGAALRNLARRTSALAGLLVLAGGCALFPEAIQEDIHGLQVSHAPVYIPPTDQQITLALKHQNPSPLCVQLGGPEPADSGLELTAAQEKQEEKGKEASLPKVGPADEKEATTPGGLTLDQVINTALLADPKIRAGLEVINQANADLLTTSLLPNPTLSADVQLLPLTRPFTVDRQGGPPQTDYQLSYPIDWFLFGKRAAAMASAAAGVRVSEADYGDLVRTRVTDAATAFYDVLETRALVRLARQDLENLRRVEAATVKGAKAGGRPAVDVSRVRLDVLRSEQALREAETARIAALAKLRAKLGRKDADPAFDVSGSLDAALTDQPLPVEEALALAEKYRPDIMSLRLQIDRAGRDVQNEKHKAYPQVTPLLGYTHQFQQKAIGFPDADSWMVAVSTSLPILDRNQGNIAKAQSVLSQNNLNLETGLADLRAEIVQVVRDLEAARQSTTAVAEQQLKAATDVRDSITKSFEGGGQTILDVLDAQRNYRETYRLYITSRATYWRSVIRFNSAIGKQVLHHDQQPFRRPGGPCP
jgi:cobalt-zinc-cadmium efflux system outer membrane protein